MRLGPRNLKELSLAINTPDGIVLIVGCSHPGIEAIVAEAAAINPRIRFVAGGFHLVAAQDAVLEKVVAALRDTYKVERIAPGHCSGEHTFSVVKQIFGDRYQYALVVSCRSAPTPTLALGSEREPYRCRSCSHRVWYCSARPSNRSARLIFALPDSAGDECKQRDISAM